MQMKLPISVCNYFSIVFSILNLLEYQVEPVLAHPRFKQLIVHNHPFVVVRTWVVLWKIFIPFLTICCQRIGYHWSLPSSTRCGLMYCHVVVIAMRGFNGDKIWWQLVVIISAVQQARVGGEWLNRWLATYSKQTYVHLTKNIYIRITNKFMLK